MEHVTSLPRGLLALALALCSLAACDAATPSGSLVVDVVTGLVPGREFDVVRVTRWDANDPFTTGSERLVLVEARARFGQDFEQGRRFAELRVPVGTSAIRVELVRADGSVLVSRRVVVAVGESTRVVRVPLTRDCVSVECPAPAGSPALNECVGGRCTDPRCEPPDPTYCPEVAFCNDASECAIVAGCAERRCEDGLCEPVARAASDPSACPAGSWCDPGFGCRAEMGRASDAGVGGDAGAGPICGTVGCEVSNECIVGYWQCEAGTPPRCVEVGNRSAGAPCADGAGACDGLGTCVVP
jgi:hypothetical protein